MAADLAQRVRAFFAAGGAPDVVAAYVFGSVARGTARSGSDLDVALLYAAPPAPTLDGLRLDVAGELELALGVAVDVVVLDGAPVDLVHRVLCDGVIVCERDRSARVRFEVRARNEYFDLLPVLRSYRRARPAT